jgi:thymidylate synthase
MWSLALLTRMLAQQCDLEPGEAVWTGGDVHLYLNHSQLVEAQLEREPNGEARLTIERRPKTIFGYAIEDFTVSGYTPQAAIRAPVAV